MRNCKTNFCYFLVLQIQNLLRLILENMTRQSLLCYSKFYIHTKLLKGSNHEIFNYCIYLVICKTHSRTPWQNRSISRLTETKNKTKNSQWHIYTSLVFPLEGELLFFNRIFLSWTQSKLALLSLRQTSHSRLIFAFVTFQTNLGQVGTICLSQECWEPSLYR